MAVDVNQENPTKMNKWIYKLKQKNRGQNAQSV